MHVTMEEFSKIYVPLIGAAISLLSVVIALTALRFARADRQEKRREDREDADRRGQERLEEQKAAEADALRRQQQALLDALQGEKEAVGFMALQLVRQPKLVTDENRFRLFSALCLAFVFESSSRARALVLEALRSFSKDEGAYTEITELLEGIDRDFKAYESALGPGELTDYYPRIRKLKACLRPGQ